ncbi:putative sulfate exporter family transporter [Leeuwenhoekiella aequorea]|uniref:YeiH family protein n=1 Tax=Leeuwenhoekiella aequorea TaxID=283736 RepID=UPI00352BDA52
MNYTGRIIENRYFSYIIYGLLIIVCLTTRVNAALALLLGLVVAQLVKNPLEELSQKIIQVLLKCAVVGLGFGMNLQNALEVGKQGFNLTIFSITSTLFLGIVAGKYLGIDKKISQLIASGTAICGGSAIAAISPIIRANPKQISVGLGIVFMLNSIALFVFPALGHLFEMTQHQFGMWCAIAIHDTSSVIGAANVYGNEALQVATTVKLARALWIIPVSIFFVLFSKGSSRSINIPYFILFFILAIVASTYLNPVQVAAPYIVSASKISLTLVLFLIGSTLNFKLLKDVGMKPILLGIGLWIFIAVSSLLVIMN